MSVSSESASAQAMLFFMGLAVVALSGCSRTNYREQADSDAYCVIEERNDDPRWFAANYGIEIDPRSRYFDAFNPDCSPMPADDPVSHEYMYRVDGKRGWKHWHDNGERVELENPVWREVLGDYVEIGDEGSVQLDADAALRLAYIHSPLNQRQLETLYLTALDVTRERFRLDTQFFGGTVTSLRHNGGIPPTLDSSFLDVRNDLELNRRLATAGDVLVAIANSFTWEFAHGDVSFASSVLSASIVQPLLRGAGRDIALEQLTAVERTLLANLRAYSQFRQGFYTRVNIGELGVTGPQRFGSSTDIQSFSGQGGASGYLGLIQRRQQIRNSNDNLSLQLRTLDRLLALYDNDWIDIVQVDQFRQDVERQRSDLLLDTNALELALDTYKTGTLGLPPDLPIELDESLIRQFQLIPREATVIQNSILELQRRAGEVADLLDLGGNIADQQVRVSQLSEDAELATIRQVLSDVLRTVVATQRRFDDLPDDLARLEVAPREPRPAISDTEIELIQFMRSMLREGPSELSLQFNDANSKLQLLEDRLSEGTKGAIIIENVVWLLEILRVSQGCVLIQSRARNIEGEPDRVLQQILEVIEPVHELLQSAREDLAHMNEMVPAREKTMTVDEKKMFREEREQLILRFVDLEKGEKGFISAVTKLEMLRDGLSDQTRRATSRGLVSWVGGFLQLVERLVLVPAQARLEVIMVDSIDMTPRDAFQVALVNRLDFMNGRAALVDDWRQLAVTADALQSGLTVSLSGDLRTSRNNPLSFDGRNSTGRASVRFDAPLTRLEERNAYRESIIRYQQSRRSFIQSHDSLHLGLRALLRNLEQLRRNLEIQRRAVTIALSRVDQTQLSLNPPRQPVQPGQRSPINPTTAINLLGAQNALRSTQNAFLAVWLNHRATRIRLYRELGIMKFDSEGRWIENPLEGDELDAAIPADGLDVEELEVPPLIPIDWIEVVNWDQTES